MKPRARAAYWMSCVAAWTAETGIGRERVSGGLPSPIGLIRRPYSVSVPVFYSLGGEFGNRNEKLAKSPGKSAKVSVPKARNRNGLGTETGTPFLEE
jgi:hypothetical protein